MPLLGDGSMQTPPRPRHSHSFALEMTIKTRITRPLATASLFFAGVAAAWTPYDGAAPYGYGVGPAGSPPAEQQPPADDGRQPSPPPYSMQPGYHVQPPGYPMQPPGFPMRPIGHSRSRPQPPGQLRLSPEVRDDAYVLTIDLDGQDAADVDVSPQGNALVITHRRSANTEYDQRFDNGRGYQRGWSWSSGQSSRRLPVPPDADMSGMRREQTEQQVRIIIPRQTPADTDTQ
jgi:hypothetical protein